MHATLLWSLWQALLRPFRYAFTAPGWRRFVEWITGLALNVEEHTVTQSLLALDRPDDWKALETFVETGHWNQPLLVHCFARLLDTPVDRHHPLGRLVAHGAQHVTTVARQKRLLRDIGTLLRSRA